MDLTEFLEIDILKFLDSKSQIEEKPVNLARERDEQIFSTRDYEKEINEALEKGDYAKAKDILRILKKEYGKLSRSSPKRKMLDDLIEKTTKSITNFANKNDIKEDEDLDKLTMEHEIVKSSRKKEQDSFKQQTFQQQEIPYSNVNVVNSGSQGLYFMPFMNSPLNFDDLSKKQSQEKLLLNFKQNLEKYIQKEYEKIQKEKDRIIKETIDSLKNENKIYLEKLRIEILKRISNLVSSNNNIRVLEHEMESLNKVENEIKKISHQDDKKYLEKDNIIKKSNMIRKNNPEKKVTPDENIVDAFNTEDVSVKTVKNHDSKYLDAVAAIKQNNKGLALKLLTELAKEKPNNVAIKVRLKEALKL